MTSEDAEAIHKLVMPLVRQIHDLRAESHAWQRITAELVEKRLIPFEVAEILAKFEDYREEERVEPLLELEKSQPGFAAELDRGNHPDLSDFPPDSPSH